MKIGGFFELELNSGIEYHDGALRLNTGRNAFEYVLRAGDYSKVFLPYYICNVMLKPLKKTDTPYDFYHIDENFFPIFDFGQIGSNEALLYINYFGICGSNVKKLSQHRINLVVDNAQAFFFKPRKDVATFYSGRKFFGVPDGAYLYTERPIDDVFEYETSRNRMSHLLSRIEDGPNVSYEKFKRNSISIGDSPIRRMSKISQRVFKNIDYNFVKKRRRENFHYLHYHLAKRNQIKIDLSEQEVPMVYPFLPEKQMLQNEIIKKGVYIAKYWKNVEHWVEKNTVEYQYSTGILPLPIDQRYSTEHMDFILKAVIDC